jgi:hypothetical protein
MNFHIAYLNHPPHLAIFATANQAERGNDDEER